MNQEEFLSEKLCEYRNCTNVISGRIDKKYCCRLHKSYERTYRNRRKKFLEKYKIEESKKVEAYKELVNIIKNN